MKTYVADFIPRFKKFSKELDASSLLINQHWVLVGEIESTKTMYIFRRRITKLIDKSPNLIVSKDGLVENGFWELLDSETLLIKLGEKSFLFKHGFLDENILALKLDGKDEFAIFFNESRGGGELNSIGSMQDFLEEKYYPKPAVEPPKDVEENDWDIVFGVLFVTLAGVVILYILSSLF